jgi:hypothetical protein
MGRFAQTRWARMSSGQYCLIRDLGLVKGGKGLRHHGDYLGSCEDSAARARRPAPKATKVYISLTSRPKYSVGYA